MKKFLMYLWQLPQNILGLIVIFFSDGKYEIVWGEESFEIIYDFDGKGDTYKTITVEYLK